MKVTINRFNKDERPFAVITASDKYSLTQSEIWENNVGMVQKPKNKQKLEVTYNGKLLGNVWNFGEARQLIQQHINDTCYLLDIA